MFYSEAILCRRGKLARVWLASHLENRLSKNQFLHADIGTSVGNWGSFEDTSHGILAINLFNKDSMIGADSEPMALRLSSQLLLGLARIYSRKARYLLEDCKEVVLKLRTTFKDGVIDLPINTATLTDNPNTITLEAKVGELDCPPSEPEFDFDSMGSVPRHGKGDPSKIMQSQNITLSEAGLAFDRRKITDDDITFEIDGMIDLNTGRPHENDPEWEFDIGFDDGNKRPADSGLEFAHLEVEAARKIDDHTPPFIPHLQDTILSSMHHATDISIIDKKARLDNESSEHSLPLEFPRRSDILTEMPFVDFNNDIDINPYFFGHRGGIGNMQALPKTKIPSHPPVSKRPFVLVDKDTESSPRDIEGGRSKSANNLFIPNTKKEHDIREIEKLGAAYYTSSSYLPYPKELKAACDAHAPILPAQFKGAHEASCYASPVEALQYTHIPALDTPNVPLVAVNEHIPPPYILSPQSPPLSNVNVDLNLSDPLWDSPKSRHAKNSRILIVAIENHEGPISLSSLLKDCSRSVVVDVFFEVLALKSKDKISVSQSHPYGEIIVSKEVGV